MWSPWCCSRLCLRVQEPLGDSPAPVFSLLDCGLPDLPSLDDLLLSEPLPELDWVSFLT